MTVLEQNFFSNINHLAEKIIASEKKIDETIENVSDMRDELKKLDSTISRLTDTLARIAARL